MPTLLLLGLRAVLAAPPLVPAADVAEPELQAWWREGDLLVGVPTRQGRPGVRPLVSLAPLELPRSFEGWTPIGERCEPTPTATAVLEGVTVTAEIDGPVENPLVVLRAGGRVLASNALGRPVRPCALSIVQADSLPGLEIVVAWRQGVTGPDESDPVPAPADDAAEQGAAPAVSEAPSADTSVPDGIEPDGRMLRGIIVFHIPDTAR